MAAKKDFSKMKTGSVYDALADATAEAAEPAPQIIPRRKNGTAPTKEEIDLARAQGKTQGRAGVRALRINMAFSPDVHEYIRTMARVRGQTVTQFTEAVFRKSMEDNAEIYEQAKAFQETL